MLAAWDACLRAPQNARTQAVKSLYEACDCNDLMHMRLLALLKTLEQHGSETAPVRQALYLVNTDNSTKNDHSTTTTVQAQQAQVTVAANGSTATMSHASQQCPSGEFSGEALKAEIAELFTLVAGRLEALEAADRPEAMAALTALRGIDFSKTATEQDALQMLNDLWDDAMKKRYSVLSKVVDALAMHAGPVVVSFVKSALKSILA